MRFMQGMNRFKIPRVKIYTIQTMMNRFNLSQSFMHYKKCCV